MKHLAQVLIVDDEQDIRLLCRLTLEMDGYVVVEACDGREGLTAIAASPPDIVIVDGRMPNMNGLEFIQALRADACISQIPVIMLTALAGVWDIEDAMRAGATNCLTKPFVPAELSSAVGLALEL